MTTFYIIFKGNVQGILFRKFVKDKANFLSLTGWVRNMHTFDEVESILEGSEDKVNSLISFCKEYTKLIDISVKEIPPLEFESFNIRY